jgi:hypothetical protein
VKSGVLVNATRATDAPAFDLRVQYDGESSPTFIHVPGTLAARFSVLFDAEPPNNRFLAGDIVAAPLAIPDGQAVDVFAQPLTYYTQIVPVLQRLERHLIDQGHADARVRVGEDVGQLDMVACASPHWGPGWLGGTSQSVNAIVANCVLRNVWAIKQLLQTRPTILFLVGQSTWTMFRHAFGHLITGDPALPAFPEDGPYTLLRATTDREYSLQYATTIGNRAFQLSTRLVITPHFSYTVNFMPQFRMPAARYEDFQRTCADAVTFLEHDSRFVTTREPGVFVSIGIKADADAALSELTHRFPAAAAQLKPAFYDAHAMMAAVLMSLYNQRRMTYVTPPTGRGFLARGEGPCSFCVNDHWTFPEGCPYGKPDEPRYPVGFLEEIAHRMAQPS